MRRPLYEPQLGKIDAEYHAQRLSKVFEMSSKPAPAENVYTLCPGLCIFHAVNPTIWWEGHLETP